MRKIIPLFTIVCSTFIISACKTTATQQPPERPVPVMEQREHVEAVPSAPANVEQPAPPAEVKKPVVYKHKPHVKTKPKPPIPTPPPPTAQTSENVPHAQPEAVAVETAEAKPVVIKRTILRSSKVFSYQGNDYCKQYHEIRLANGANEEINGVACKQPNGKWRTMS